MAMWEIWDVMNWINFSSSAFVRSAMAPRSTEISIVTIEGCQ